MSADLPRDVGPYRLEELLGQGGMGEVYKAYDQRLDRRVAIKHIRPEAADKPASRARFRREAWMAAGLSHPGLVQIFDILEEDDGDWIVMELIDGPSIAEKLRNGPLALESILDYGRQVAAALAEAHLKNIIHRDLKSENVMLTSSGHAKLLDFGLAKPLLTGRFDVSLSAQGEVKGTVRAMSPEQARGFEVDPRSDLFSFGTLLYEMSTGESPFLGETQVDTLTRVCTHQQQPALELNPSLPEELSEFIDCLLEKAPEMRPASARQAADELARIADQWTRQSSPPPTSRIASAILDQETYVGSLSSASPASPGGAVIRTLLLIDLVDSTALFARLGDRRTAEVSEHHDAMARALLPEHGGREIDKSDGFLLLFERPVDAVAYALAYHRALADLSRENDFELSARAGIHLGEVFLRENPPEAVSRGAKPLEVEGLAKATAARVMALAIGRQTLMTHSAFDLARRGAVGELEDNNLHWIDHGTYQLQGVDESLEVYEVGVVGFSPLASPVDRRKATRIAEPRTTPGSGSESATRAAIGAGQSNRRWLMVLAVLGATALLVVLALAARRGTTGSSASGPADTAAEEPHALYEQGWAYLRRYDREDNIDKAIAAFQRILAQNENSAPAYAGLGRAYWHKYAAKSRDRQLLEQGRAIAQRAVSLDEHLAVARVTLGLVYASLGQPAAAREEFEKALTLESSNADAYWGLGQIHEAQNELQEAETAYIRATELDPSSWLIANYLGTLYFKSDRYEKAEGSFLRSIELAPDSVSSYRNLAGAYFLQGREGEAASVLQKAIAIRPEPSLYANLGTMLFYQGLYQQAAAAYEKAMAGEGSAANRYFLWGNLGDAYRWTPDGQDRARKSYLRAIQLIREEIKGKPEHLGLQSRLTLYLAKRGDTDQAHEILSELATALRLSAGDWYRMTVAHEILDQRTQALGALKRALRAGFSPQEVRRDPELLQLRSDPDYHRLMSDFDPEFDS